MQIIKLKDLLLESDKFYPAHTRQAINWVTMKQYLPLYPKQMEKLVGKQQVNSFHVTGPGTIKNVGETDNVLAIQIGDLKGNDLTNNYIITYQKIKSRWFW